MRSGGAPISEGGRSIFWNVATRGGQNRLALLLRRISFWLQLFAVRGYRPPPFTNRELPRKDLRVVNARLVGDWSGFVARIGSVGIGRRCGRSA